MKSAVEIQARNSLIGITERCSKTVKNLQTEDAYLRKPYEKRVMGGEFWAAGYYVVMVGKRAS